MSHDKVMRAKCGMTLETAVRRILRTFDAATPSDIEAGAQWYPNGARIVADMVGGTVTLEHAAAVLAHLSPRTPWSRNVAGAVELVTTGNAPAGHIGRNVDGAVRALESDDPLSTLNGPKTRRFAANFLGDTEAVTVDVWALRVVGIHDDNVISRVGAYDAVEHAYRLAARRRGVDPSTMQATTWIVARGGRVN